MNKTTESDMITNDEVVRFSHVTKKYQLYKDDKKRLLGMLFGARIPHKTKVASNDLSFSIKRGESVAFLGRNGAGKSTLLKIITGVVFPTSGEAFINGRVSALLELTAGFDGEFTGRENIYLRAHLMGLEKKQIKAAEKDIVEFAELDEYIDQPVRTYSSGMKARLGFAINVSINPEILVVDEALSVGDMKFQEKCRVRLSEIMKKDHVTVLLVTHSIGSAKSFCNRGIVLKNGSIIFDGNINDAAEAYKESNN
ncbi:MAG: ABC transporter ATP-binding protein [bacterium]|nr:ABC transporter ATP-binding protein [bacterium]